MRHYKKTGSAVKTFKRHQSGILKRIIENIESQDLPGNFSYSSKLEFSINKNEYCRQVKVVQDYISAGDVFQVNLSHRLSAQYSGSAAELYAKLTQINPSPYAAWLHWKQTDVVSCSPELLVELKNGKILTAPIAGTHPRSLNEVADREFVSQLVRSEKEKSEHLMLVDLERQ